MLFSIMHARLLSITILIFLSLITGCQGLEAQTEAERGLLALKHCDFELARQHFKHADQIYPNHQEIVLGLGISELLSALDTSKARSVLNQLWGQSIQELCLKAHANSLISPTETPDSAHCHSFSRCALFQTHDTAQSFAHTIDSNLEWEAIIEVLSSPRLAEAGKTLTQASQILDGAYAIHDFAGYPTLYIHSADLAALGVLSNLAYILSNISQSHDWRFRVSETLHELEAAKTTCRPWLATTLLERVCATPKPIQDLARLSAALSNAFQSLARLSEILQTQEAHTFQTTQSNCHYPRALLAWQTIHPGIVKDLNQLAKAYDNNQFVPKGLMDPTPIVSISTLLATPLCASKPAFSYCIQTQSGDELQVDWSWLSTWINHASTPPFLETTTLSFIDGVHYRLNSAWLQFDPKALLCETPQEK